MTARSGDALSHVKFQARRDIVLTTIGCLGSRLHPLRLIVVNRGRVRSCRICMTGMSGHTRNESGGPPSFEHYLRKSLLNV
jgi:hypothetical protein